MPVEVHQFNYRDLMGVDLLYKMPDNEFDLMLSMLSRIDPSLSYSLFMDEELIACGGLCPKWPGVAEAWVVLTTKAKERKATRALLHACKAILPGASDNFVRIQCHVLITTNGAPMRFAKRFGFKSEGLMRKYLPNGEDAVMMSLVS